MASGDSVQQIKDRLNIIDVVTPYVELTRAGRQWKGRCPFHNEKSPSFHVSPERGTYHCFGCGVGGDIFSFVQAIDGVDFKEALKTLAGKAGVELVPEQPEKRTEREHLVAVLEAATSYYEGELAKTPEALAYLEKRGVTKETIAKWRIGFAPGPPARGWREVRTHLTTLGYNDALLLKAGLVKTAEGGKEPFDVFRDRIMFPLRDNGGRIVAFSGRILHPDEKSPKYVNSPETELFHKSELLYGYDFAKHHLRQLPFWLLVEGQFDVVMSHQAGYSTAIAVSGTAFTPHHVKLLERLSMNVVLGLDTDKAGIAAMKKAADLMLRRGMDVKVARFADGADPADMVASDLKGFKQAIGHAVHIIEFLLEHLRTLYPDERAYKLHVRDEVVPFVTLIPNRIDQDHFEGIIASALETSKDAIHYEVERLQQKSEGPLVFDNGPSHAVVANQTDLLEKTLAYLVAAIAVVPAGEAAGMKQAIETITGQSYDEVVLGVSPTLISELTFTLEDHLNDTSLRTRYNELLHRVNLLATVWHKQKIEVATQAISEGGEAHDAALATIASHSAALRREPFTEAIFTA